MDNELLGCELTRRQLLHALAGSLGVALIGTGGCSSTPEGESATPGSAAHPIAATRNPDNTFTVPGGGGLQPGTALAFTMPSDTASDKSPGIVFVAGNGEIGALSAKCTHAGCTVEWQGGQSELRCPCHGSQFDAQGKVLKGPATKPLPRYKAARQGDNVIITI